MANPLRTVILAVLGVAVLAGGVSGDAVPWHLGEPYVLMGGSSFQEGCFPPCACPIMPPRELLGTCLLIHEPLRTMHHTYALEYIDWWVVLDGEIMPITGYGTYMMQPGTSPAHRLQLELSIDGGPLRSFDSGFVRGGRDFPDIVATVSLNGEYCYDTVLEISAIPNLGCPWPPDSTPQQRDRAVGESQFQKHGQHWGRRTDTERRKPTEPGPLLADFSYGECAAGSADGNYPWCGADDFKWFVGAGTLDITHAAAAYNCCPEDITLNVEMLGDRLRLTETQILPAPCNCMCCHELQATIVNLPPGPLLVEYCWMDEEDGPSCAVARITVPGD